MLCFVHGYGLTGSGSNQWSRSVAQGLCEIGETVHLFCQENRPEQFDFVSEAFSYDPSGKPTRLFHRHVPYSGRAVVHRPELDILPTYVRPQATNKYMAAILDLPREKIDAYLARNAAAMRTVLDQLDITAVHVNHVVLMAVVVNRVCKEFGVPFGVMPHGSAIEYVVKHDEHMRALATEALSAADTIFTLSEEMGERIENVFPDVPNARAKMVMASAGVDTRQFHVIDRSSRADKIERLECELREMERGKKVEQRRALRDGLRDDMSLDDLLGLLASVEDYPPKLPDEGIENLLDAVDWTSDEIITFVGKLIGYKGLPALAAAFPAILERRPNARLIIAGRGNLRAGLEAFIYALSDGHRTLARNIIRWGGAVEGEEEMPFERPANYFDELERRGGLDAYFDAAERLLTPDRVIFTGYMEHHLLCHLFPCCDVAIFPSVVKEAAPLVVPESMASGCFPVGTDYAGMGASLSVAAQAVPDDVGRLMRLRHDARYTTQDIVENVSSALEITDKYRESLREIAVARYDWRSVADTLAKKLTTMTSSAQAATAPNWRAASSR